MTYIDEMRMKADDLELELEPLIVQRDWGFLMSEVNRAEERGQKLIFQGYALLMEKFPEASDEQLLDTSLVWWFG